MNLSYVLATAGHVDHGKSALVRALTGIDPDRLPEEKKRGITIDLGFAHLSLPASGGVTYDIGIVDVPGHEDFVKNMVAGVGSIDAAMLIVAADDGWMPQTEEHLRILMYLGVRRGIVALTKVDLIHDARAATDAIRAKLRGAPLADAPIVATSVKSGAGLEELRAALIEVLSSAQPQPDIGRPRLSVDRVFSSKGAGTIVTGTLIGGSFSRGQAVMIQPSRLAAHVRGVQTHHRALDVAHPGSRVALNLPELSPDPADTDRAVRRGDVVTLAGVGVPSRVMDVLLDAVDRDAVEQHAGPAVRSGVRMKLHHGAAAGSARAQLLDTDALRPGQRVLARLTLDEPLLWVAGDRFLLRSASEQQTLAGGVVLDVQPRIQRGGLGRDARQQALLRARAADPRDARMGLVSILQRDGFVDMDIFRATCDAPAEAVGKIAETLAREGSIIIAGGLLAHIDAWAELLRQAGALIDRRHADHPQQAGLPIGEVRAVSRAALLRAKLPEHAEALGDRLIEALCAEGYARVGAVMQRTGYRPILPPRLKEAGDACLRRLEAQPFDPPSRKILCATDAASAALKFLVAGGTVIDLGEEVLLAASAYAQAAQRVRAHLAAHGPSTVAELKTMLGSSRRVMVPLLERLDREGITRRDGNLRRLPQPSSQAKCAPT